MFMTIDTKQATHIFIEVPVESAAVALPTLVRLFESSAMFVRKSWRDASILKPEVTISLGDEVIDDGELVLKVHSGGHPISEGFDVPTPQVSAGFAKVVADLNEQLLRARQEVAYLKGQLQEKDEKILGLGRVIEELRASSSAG